MFPVLLLSIPSIPVDRLSPDIATVVTDENTSDVSTAVTEAFDCEAASEFVDKVISVMAWNGTASDVCSDSVNDDSISVVTSDEIGLLVSAVSVDHVFSPVSLGRDEFLLESELSCVCVCSPVK